MARGGAVALLVLRRGCGVWYFHDAGLARDDLERSRAVARAVGAPSWPPGSVSSPVWARSRATGARPPRR
eukprot:9587358-Lingulodinium_polyedra.AAC.1